MRFPTATVLLSVSLCAACPAQAQTVLDGSTNSLVRGNLISPVEGGTVSGGNLFHSFKQFNVPTSGVIFGIDLSSYVIGSEIKNIINRVTGSDPSAILGKIESRAAFPNANLFLINPNGIVFGQNARLDIGGSFSASTATGINFDNGSTLTTNLTSAFPESEPRSFQFAVTQPAGILSQGNLAVGTGQSITLAGGSVVSTGSLEAPDGSVRVAAVQGNSEVILRSPDSIAGLRIDANAVPSSWQGTIAELPKLAKLLTGDAIGIEANQVVVNPDGSLQLVSSALATGIATVLLPTGLFDTTGRFSIKAGDAAIKQIAAGVGQIIASGNIALLLPNIQTTRELFLTARDTITIRDTASAPAVIRAGGTIFMQGDRSIDILSLNFAANFIESVFGSISFTSNGNILLDGYFKIPDSPTRGIFATPLPDALPGTTVKLRSAINFDLARGQVFFKLPASQSSIQTNIKQYREILAVDSRTAAVVTGSNVPKADSPDPKLTNTSESAPLGSATPKNGSEPKPSPSYPVSIIPTIGGIVNPNIPGNKSLSDVAGLLLEGGLILEARQALDQSIVQEISSYVGESAQPDSPLADVVDLSLEQQQLYTKYAQLEERITILDRRLVALSQVPEPNRNESQRSQVVDLTKQRDFTSKELQNFSSRPEVSKLARHVSEVRLAKLQNNLKSLNQGAVLLYPLILDDRLELILVTPDGEPIRRTTYVTRKQLDEQIRAFRNGLETVYDPAIDARIPGQKLYEWMIEPIEQDLINSKAKTILYAPYAQLRYVPLAALYDGDRWLIERFRINNITSASLQDFSTKSQVTNSIFAGAVTRSASFKIGDRSFNMPGLPFARREVENLAAMMPNSIKLLDNDFSPASTKSQLNKHSLIHLATHAAFLPGKPKDSFILFGNGERVTLEDVKKSDWQMKNVDLFVLSACDTALGEVLGNGEEILGFGYLMQQSGARASIASLWSVDDGGTQVLMDIFYSIINKPGMTKAEALRQAQIALITGDFEALGPEGAQIRQNIKNRLPASVAEYLNHPYYWAPFIMIGNGL